MTYQMSKGVSLVCFTWEIYLPICLLNICNKYIPLMLFTVIACFQLMCTLTRKFYVSIPFCLGWSHWWRMNVCVCNVFRTRGGVVFSSDKARIISFRISFTLKTRIYNFTKSDFPFRYVFLIKHTTTSSFKQLKKKEGDI